MRCPLREVRFFANLLIDIVVLKNLRKFLVDAEGAQFAAGATLFATELHDQAWPRTEHEPGSVIVIDTSAIKNHAKGRGFRFERHCCFFLSLKGLQYFTT